MIVFMNVVVIIMLVQVLSFILQGLLVNLNFSLRRNLVQRLVLFNRDFLFKARNLLYYFFQAFLF